MPDVVQWTIDQFWAQLQTVKGLTDGIQVDLDQNKRDLTRLYSQARAGNLPGNVYGPPDPRVVAAATAALDPLIHRNSVLRTEYLATIKTKFNDAVRAASADIARAGYTVPQLYGLSGLGSPIVIAGIIVGVVAVTAITVALTWASVTRHQTDVQLQQTQAVNHEIAQVNADPSLSPDQKVSRLNAIKGAEEALAKELAADKPPGDDLLKSLMPILAVVAAIVLLPPILQTLPKRQAAT